MVFDDGVKDQESLASTSSAGSSGNPIPPTPPPPPPLPVRFSSIRAGRPPRPFDSKALGVRHPIKHRRFHAAGSSSGSSKMMVDSTTMAPEVPVTSSPEQTATAPSAAAATVVTVAAAEHAAQEKEQGAEEVGYTSGGWKSEDGSLSCGYSSFRGKRATMEDFYDVKSSRVDNKQISLFGIFDGHGGSRAAEYLKDHLFENLMKHPGFMTDTKLAISETYQKTDSDFLHAESNSHRDDGSTASTAVLVGSHLYVANVGDSRAIISKAGKAIPLSDDHKPNRSDERKRIENAGGVVMWAGTWRVGGVLAMSRAFGNRLLKQFVVADPEIQEQEIDEELEFLILASDGLWDVVANEDAVSLVRVEEEPEAAARKLTETAYSRGSADNITCIVVKFHHDVFVDGDSPFSVDSFKSVEAGELEKPLSESEQQAGGREYFKTVETSEAVDTGKAEQPGEASRES